MKSVFDPFDMTQLRRLLDDFIEKAPSLLVSIPQTSHLALSVGRLKEQSDLPFTIAIVGQMRIGKSSLINALIGEDLAPVNVNETTATINYFRYSQKNGNPTFRVHWREKPPEDFPIGDRYRWCGKSGLAEQTRFVELFSSADILKKLNIVDTPGTRSVLEDHGIKIDEFMAERQERETLRYGGRADTIVYLLGAVARDTDAEFLERFSGQTRKIGSSPFNSIAVLHKWETLNAEDPLAAAYEKAERITGQLKNFVSAVVPVSAPLMRLAESQGNDFWEELSGWLSNLSDRDRRRIIEMGTERRFQNMAPELYEKIQMAGLPWPSFKAIHFIAKNNDYPSAKILRELVSDAGGKKVLMKVLKDRFMDRTNLIRSFILLNKSMSGCQEGQIELANHAKKLAEKIDAVEHASEILEAMAKQGITQVGFISDLLNENRDYMNRALSESEKKLTELDDLIRGPRIYLEELEQDIRQLQVLDAFQEKLKMDELREIRTVLGSYGQSAEHRTQCYQNNKGNLLESIESRLDFWRTRMEITPGPMAEVLAQIVARLEALAEYFEEARQIS